VSWRDAVRYRGPHGWGDYLRTLERRQDLKVRGGRVAVDFIDDQLAVPARKLLKSGYGAYLLELLKR
jgi:glucose-1-phosphate thymidylyltransferase